jgi:hypothetical protein
MNAKDGAAASGRTGKAQTGRGDPLVPLRQLVQQGRLGENDLRKAFVRTLLGESLGEELLGSLEFQSISDQVLQILDSTDAGRALLSSAIAELGK